MFPIEALLNRASNYWRGYLPANVTEFISSNLGSVDATLSFSTATVAFVFAVISASNAMAAYVRQVSVIYDSERRSTMKQRGLGLVLTFGMFLIGILPVVSFYMAGLFAGFLGPDFSAFAASVFDFRVIRISFLGFFVFLVFLMVYLVALPGAKKISRVLPGSTAATVITIITSAALELYFENYANYNQIYGGVTTFIVVLMWFYAFSMILLFGVKINRSFEIARDHSSEPL